MTKKMLIDATHAEETRVVVAEGNKVDEFDFESITKRQLAGNIYLAKVTRVEPSLQAAFVDYGGNRHGFLAFSEIHPDYYQIPVEDRKKLLEEEAAFARRRAEESPDDAADSSPEDTTEEAAPEDAEAEAPAEKPKRRTRTRKKAEPKAKTKKADAEEATPEDPAPDEAISDEAASQSADTPTEDPADPPDEAPEVETPTDPASEGPTADNDEAPPETLAEDVGIDGEDDVVVKGDLDDDGSLLVETPEESRAEKPKPRSRSRRRPTKAAEEDIEGTEIADDIAPSDDETPKKARPRSRTRSKKPTEGDEETGSNATDVGTAAQEDVREEMQRSKPRMRRYNIQEVIKVRQILLVQVVKEERGNKGAALTTYLSLAGRYCVLMPNTARGGGISRKITNAADRKKLKTIANEIEVPEGAGLIVRTAGAKRTKTEIKRDYEYLLRQWETIRETTLSSVAPKLIYEEGSLIKRSIRDLYNKDIEEIIVEGENGFKEAKEYMKMLLPSHAKNVKAYTDPLPLFARFQVESYLSGMINPTVQLRSGGYIVIGVTEALVAIDVNSGRATKEGSIEETALKTNLEAAEEIARQMRLRDLAGLLVIDFIDMDERRNNNAVEKRLKDALKSDRARIQIGRISGFGLLEMSRQRLRPGVLEATTTQCAHCHGTGYVRSDENMALTILREIEEEGVRQRCKEVLVKVPLSIANYLLNQKREHISMVEVRYGLSVRVEADIHMIPPDYQIERLKTATRIIPHVEGGTVLPEALADLPPVEEETVRPADDEEDGPRKRGRRRRKRGGRRNQRGQSNEGVSEAEIVDETSAADTQAEEAGEAEASVVDAPAPDAVTSDAQILPEAAPEAETQVATEVAADPEAEEEPKPAKPKAKPRTRKPATRKKKTEPAPQMAEAPSEAPAPEPAAETTAIAEPEPVVVAAAPEAPVEEPDKPKRRGWWSRALGK